MLTLPVIPSLPLTPPFSHCFNNRESTETAKAGPSRQGVLEQLWA